MNHLPATYPLNTVIEELRHRWGQRVIQSGREFKPSSQLYPFGIPPLDNLLGGGILSGCASVLVGVPTSGMTTLAYHLAAQIHAQQGEVVYLDNFQTFNPAYAAGCGVNLDQLLLVRPPGMEDSLELSRDILTEGIPGLVILDATQTTAPLPLRRLYPVLHGADAALLILAHSPIEGTHIGITLRWQSWLYQAGDICGCKVEATLTHHPRQAAGQSLLVDLKFCGV